MGVVGIRVEIPENGNSQQFLGIPSPSQGIAPPKVGLGIPGNGNFREFVGIPTPGLAFPWKAAAMPQGREADFRGNAKQGGGNC